MKGRYGGPLGTPGLRSMANGGGYKGYATGTPNASRGWSWVGEHGPELLELRGGERIKDAKQSAVIASKASNTKDTSNQGGFTLRIENFVNNRSQDVEALAQELAFYMKQKSIGGVYQ